LKKNTKVVLTIAGSDSGGGAGIQSDLKTFYNHKVYGLSVITSITSQNTLGVQSSFELPVKVISSQLKSVYDDFKISVVKTGMLSSSKVIDVVSEFIKQYNSKLIIDPVILSKNNYELLNKSGVDKLKKELIKLCFLITPNIYEAEIISGIKINSLITIEDAAKRIYEMGAKNVLIKGGHLNERIGLKSGTDVLYNEKKFILFAGEFINSKNTHGIGCTLSASITANIALGYNLKESIIKAKQYVSKLLTLSKKIGKGVSPIEQFKYS
jgi:hydroxymethylpyrimidine/phosphomethylpyrimidine kinase